MGKDKPHLWSPFWGAGPIPWQSLLAGGKSHLWKCGNPDLWDSKVATGVCTQRPALGLCHVAPQPGTFLQPAAWPRTIAALSLCRAASVNRALLTAEAVLIPKESQKWNDVCACDSQAAAQSRAPEGSEPGGFAAERWAGVSMGSGGREEVENTQVPGHMPTSASLATWHPW